MNRRGFFAAVAALVGYKVAAPFLIRNTPAVVPSLVNGNPPYVEYLAPVGAVDPRQFFGEWRFVTGNDAILALDQSYSRKDFLKKSVDQI